MYILEVFLLYKVVPLCLTIVHPWTVHLGAIVLHTYKVGVRDRFYVRGTPFRSGTQLFPKPGLCDPVSPPGAVALICGGHFSPIERGHARTSSTVVCSTSASREPWREPAWSERSRPRSFSAVKQRGGGGAKTPG